MLARLARFSFRRRWIMVFGIWVPLLVVINAVSGAIGTDYHTEFNQPDSESKQVQDALSAGGNDERGRVPGADRLHRRRRATDDPAVEAAMTGLFDKVDAHRGRQRHQPVLRRGPAVQQPGGQHRTRAVRTSRSRSSTSPSATRPGTWTWPTRSRRSATASTCPGLTIEYGGQVFGEFEFPASELLGILAAIIILLIAFGSVIAMGLPIGTALFGLGVGMAIVGLGVARCSRCPSSRRRWRR